MEDWHNFGPDYYTTLMAWWENLKTRYHELDPKKYDRRFLRMFQFYMLAAAGSSLARDGQLWHIVITKTGRKQPDCRLS
jgi:cyclopropane-fatty-acyl-phospholipid synthase